MMRYTGSSITETWSSCSTASTWVRWVNNSTWSTTSTTNITWSSWCRQVHLVPAPRIEIVEPVEARQAREDRIRAEQARIDARMREVRERTRVLDEVKAKADARAKALLVTFLTAGQRATLEQHGYFDERVEGHGTFRIYKGWAGNVRRLDDKGKEREQFCIHPIDDVPHYDNMLAQRLMLQTNPAEFFRTANRTVLS